MALLGLAVLVLAMLVLAGGCAPRPEPASETGTPAPETVAGLWPGAEGVLSERRLGCDVLAGEAVAGGSFLVQLTDEVLPAHAPIPHNASERLVFSHLYETLVRVDCSGELQPGLAVNWACSPDSTDWVFTLREDAVFWDGTRVTAADVHLDWRDRQNGASTVAGDEDHADDHFSPWNWLNSQSRSVAALDARRLAIRLPEPQARFPWLLAHPAMAVTVRRPGWTWPVGSGPCRLRATDPGPLPDVTCRPNLHHPDAPTWKQLVFRVRPHADPRDLVGENPDLMLTRDMEVVRFFAELPGYRPAALPYDRLYLLVCPPETNTTGTLRWSDAARRLDVVHDLTGVAARPWDTVAFPAGATGVCPQLSGPVADDNVARLDWGLEEHRLDDTTLIFTQTDGAARELAHRLGALAGPQTRTVGLSGPELAFSLQWQMPGACIIAHPQHFPTPCLQLASLLGRAAWLQQEALARPGAGAGDPARRLQDSGWVTPLALTRPWLIVRGALAGVELDFDGTPRLQGLGRALSEPAP